MKYGGKPQLDSLGIEQSSFDCRITEKVCGGGMGVVYPAEEQRLGRRVSISRPANEVHAIGASLRFEPADSVAEVRLQLWPGGEDRLLARSGFRGKPVEWLGLQTWTARVTASSHFHRALCDCVGTRRYGTRSLEFVPKPIKPATPAQDPSGLPATPEIDKRRWQCSS